MADAKIAAVVIGDGRLDFLRETVASYHTKVTGVNGAHIMVNDTGDSGYAEMLDGEFPEWTLVHHAERRGLGGAVRSAWTAALETDCDYLFHLEEDFTFPSAVDVQQMVRLLDAEPRLAQVVLKRQPVNSHEDSFGDIMAEAINEYIDHETDGMRWVEHGSGTALHVFSFNPCLIPRRVLELVVADQSNAMLERGVTDLLHEHGYVFGYWGSKYDAPRCWHIGTRHSSGYRW